MSSNRHRRHPAPNWQTISSSSIRKPATGISLIFAQPESGSPLRSAVDNLPALGIADSASFMSDMSKKRERSQSAATSVAPRDGDEDTSKRSRISSPSHAPLLDLPAEAAREEAQVQNVRQNAPVDGPPEPDAAHATSTAIPIIPTAVTSSNLEVSPAHASWFGSLSRATAPKLESPLAKSDAADVLASAQPPPREEPNTAPPILNFPVSSENGDEPAAAEENIPRIRVTSSPPVVSPQVLERKNEDTERRSSFSSPGPSASRFSLSLRIPLLGTFGVLSSQADSQSAQAPSAEHLPRSSMEGNPPAQTAAEDIPRPSTPANGGQLAPASSERNEESAPVTSIPGNVASEAVQGQPSSEERIGTQPTGQPAVASPSWWGYLGWSSASEEERLSAVARSPDTANDVQPKIDVSQSSPTHDQSQGTEASISQSEDSVGSSSTLHAPQDPSGTSGPAQHNPEHSGKEQLAADVGPKPASITSGETTRSDGSAWYSPWAWYSSQPAVGASNQDANGGTHAGEGSAEGRDENARTESEIVKEEALTRSESQTVDITEPTPNVEPPNPIESAVATNPASWLSFFASRHFTKTITDQDKERDENGMEVMNIDEDEDSAPGQALQVLPAHEAGGRDSPSPSVTRNPNAKSGADTPAPPLTTSETIKRKTTQKGERRSASQASTTRSTSSAPPSAKPSIPNLVLPTWEDTFCLPPRSFVPKPARSSRSKLQKTLSLVGSALWSKPERTEKKGKGKVEERSPHFLGFGQDLPKALDVVGEPLSPYLLNGGCRVAVIGVYGWSPGAVTRAFAPGTPYSSVKFVDMTCQALEQFAEEHNFKFKKVTKIPLNGDGVIAEKVAQVYDHFLSNDEWVEDLQAADVIFVTTHSQGSIVSTHLVNKLIQDGHILTKRNVDTLVKTASTLTSGNASIIASTQAQRVCFLAMCGVHLGPLRYLRTSSLLSQYLQYVENAAARELFEFQNTETQASKDYVEALRNVMDHGTKMVFIASLNDQVVPIYSGLFMAASHPRILRALYIDGDAYHSSDFLSNLLILLIRIINAGLSDSGLLAHLSEATAGSLTGIGHSTIFEEPATFAFAVKYFFLSTDGTQNHAELKIEPFNAVIEQNDYEIPWSLRDLIANDQVSHFFASEFGRLRDAFDQWQPKTSILRDVKRKLQPIQRLAPLGSTSGSFSKL